ncbi:hypothetical protein B4129_1754 [Bacillus safensis]|nr:hypothetical protein B4129_1754 [Bacillus safensis]
MSKKQEKRKKFAERMKMLCKQLAKKHDAWSSFIYSASLSHG